MFQQTIQDVLAIAEAGPKPEHILARVFERIAAFEKVECGEIVAQGDRGVFRFVMAPGLGDLGPAIFQAFGDQATSRFDTATQIKEARLLGPTGLNSVLMVRLEIAGAPSGALVLGHSRAWSFPAAPLSRIRAVGNVAIRLLLATQGVAPVPARSATEGADLVAEIARLRAHVASLQAEVAGLRADQAKRRSGKPR